MATSKKTRSKAKAKAVSVKAPQGREALKKLFWAGLGLADETREKLHQNFNTLAKRGQTKQPHVKKAVEEIRKKAMARRKELEKKFSDYVKKSEILKSKELQDFRRNWEKKLSDFAKQNRQSKLNELQQLRATWEKKFSDYVKQSGVLKSKEAKALSKKIDAWKAKAKEWETKAKEAITKSIATPVAEEEEKKWNPPTPQPVVSEGMAEKAEAPVNSPEITPSSPGVPLSTVTEETGQE